MVIDADAIRSVGVIKEKIKNKKMLLTPHANEFLELTGKQVSENIKDRINTVRKEAYELNCGKNGTCPLYPPITVVLKGNVDVVSNGKDIILNDTGSPVMTKGGCGDTLTGIAGAMLARGVDTFTAGCVSAYINGKAGEMAVNEYGEGFLPTDLIDMISSLTKFQ